MWDVRLTTEQCDLFKNRNKLSLGSIISKGNHLLHISVPSTHGEKAICVHHYT